MFVNCLSDSCFFLTNWWIHLFTNGMCSLFDYVADGQIILRKTCNIFCFYLLTIVNCLISLIYDWFISLIWHLILPIPWSTFISLQYESQNHLKKKKRTLKVFRITAGFHLTTPRAFFSMSKWSVRKHKTPPEEYPLPFLPRVHQEQLLQTTMNTMHSSSNAGSGDSQRVWQFLAVYMYERPGERHSVSWLYWMESFEVWMYILEYSSQSSLVLISCDVQTEQISGYTAKSPFP